VDRSGVAGRIETLLPVGPRPRQLSVQALLVGMLACQADGRPAHLCRVHQALVALPAADQARLGITAAWKTGPHTLTYRQVEYTFGRVVSVLGKPTPDGTPSHTLAGIVDELIEASIPDCHKTASTSLAVDWTDHESFSRPPGHPGQPCADPEASWGHRRGHAPGQKHQAFYGYYLSASTMTNDESGPPVPELIRNITLTTCHIDPVVAMVPVLARYATTHPLGDVLTDSGYSHRVPKNWALPLRGMGAQHVFDLHPHDRGPHGTHAGAVTANGNLYCPATPTALLNISPPPTGANPEQIATHDRQTAEAAHYKLTPINRTDPDGYHRAACPATTGKIRCSHRPQSLTLPYDRPEIGRPPDPRPVCCTQKTVTIPPTVNAKTRQKHDYPGPAWRTSYARRTAAERAYSTLKDPATNNINRGWCRLHGLAPILLFLTATTIIRNQRISDAYTTRTTRPTPQRPRRRTTIATLTGPDP
jgi:hypothetical protein